MLTQLESLFLFSNEMTEVTPLQGLTQLRSRSLRNNPSQQVTPLQSLSRLAERLLFKYPPLRYPIPATQKPSALA